jgi:hypothetical protein
MLLLAVVPWHLYWSQNARFYTSLLLFFNLALFSFHVGMEEDKPLYLIASLVFLGVAVMERLVALTFVPIVTLYWVLLFVLRYERPAGWRWRTFLIYIIPGLLVGIPFMWPIVSNLTAAVDNFGFINNNPAWILAGVVFYITVPIFLLGLTGMWVTFAERNRTGLLLSLGALLPLLLVMAVSLFQYSANRYVFIALPSWLVLASVAALRLLDGSSKRSRIVAVTVLAIMIMAPMVDNVMYFRFNSGNRPNWKAAYAYVERNWQPGDIVAVPEPLLGEYYMPGKTVDVASLDLDAVETGDQRVWFLEDLNLEYQRNAVYEWLHSKSIESAVFDVQVQARNFKMRVHEYQPPVLTQP